MTSLLISSPLIRISHRLFRCRYSNSWDTVASSPSFSRPAARVPRRAYSQATKFIDTQRKCIFKVTWDQRGKKQFLIWLVRDKENRCLRVPDRIMNQLLLKGWILLDCLQSPVSPQDCRDRALCIRGRHLGWVSKLLTARRAVYIWHQDGR